jgi:hypothetical protein
VADLRQALDRENLKLLPGDAVIIHTGWGKLLRQVDWYTYYAGSLGTPTAMILRESYLRIPDTESRKTLTRVSVQRVRLHSSRSNRSLFCSCSLIPPFPKGRAK